MHISFSYAKILGETQPRLCDGGVGNTMKPKEKMECQQWPGMLATATMGGARKPPGPINVNNKKIRI